MKILLIAPRSNLQHVAREVQNIVNTPGLDVHLLHDTVTESDISTALRGDIYQMIWFAGHGNPDGVAIGDWLLSGQVLATYVRASSIKYVFINTCESASIAAWISNETNADVICTISTVDDLMAYRTGSLFADSLGKRMGVREAYETSKPAGNRNYIYLATAITDMPADIHKSLVELKAEIQDVKRDVAQIWKEIKPAPKKKVSNYIFWGILLTTWTTTFIPVIWDYYGNNLAIAFAILLAALTLAILIRWLPE